MVGRIIEDCSFLDSYKEEIRKKESEKEQDELEEE